MLHVIVSLLLVLTGNPPTAQELIDRAAPGSVVYLRPENALDGVHPLRIWKPLSIVGKPRVSIYTVQPDPFVPLEPAIRLLGQL